MRSLLGLVVILAAWGGVPLPAGAEQPKLHRVGVIQPGGPFSAVVEGLREGLRELGLVPIVFVVGSDPVKIGLVQSFARPGGRLTGVHLLAADVTGKRLQLLKDLVPKLRRAVTFYDPRNQMARNAASAAREASQRLGVELLERHVGSVAELQAALGALKPGEAEAFFLVTDAMIISQAPLIIEAARGKRLATMFHERSLAERGALAAYGPSYHGAGRQSAKHVQRVLAGTPPADLPVENFDRFEFVVNVRTARELGLTIPPEVGMLVDKIVE